MGGSESKATVLECMIKNFKKGLGGDYRVKMKPNRLHILWWPSYSHRGPFDLTEYVEAVRLHLHPIVST